MKIIGIVSEYNPFHKGHQYQIEKSRQDLNASGVVAIMSGNFVQRGYPAIYNKWVRAEMAVRSGVNLVIELPTYFATSSAEPFARGAVELLHHSGVVTHLSFGSEVDDLNALKEISTLLNNPTDTFTEALSTSLTEGSSFPAARSKALAKALPELVTRLDLNQSNIILAVEYLKALQQLNSTIEPYLVKRQGSSYHDDRLDSPFVSATAVRKLIHEMPERLFTGDWIPQSVMEVLKRTPFRASKIEDFEKLILYALRMSNAQELSSFRDISEGLENKLLEASHTSSTYEMLVQNVKSKRYTQTRINRVLLNTLLGIKPIEINLEKEGYFRVLAFDEVGQKILREMKKKSSLPVITNINKHKDFLAESPLLQLDVKATEIYQLGQIEPAWIKGGLDFLAKPYQHKIE